MKMNARFYHSILIAIYLCVYIKKINKRLLLNTQTLSHKFKLLKIELFSEYFPLKLHIYHV